MKASNGPTGDDIREDCARALGWSFRDTLSLSLPALRDLVRHTHPKLAEEVTRFMQTSAQYIATPEPNRKRNR